MKVETHNGFVNLITGEEAWKYFTRKELERSSLSHAAIVKIGFAVTKKSRYCEVMETPWRVKRLYRQASFSI